MNIKLLSTDFEFNSGMVTMWLGLNDSEPLSACLADGMVSDLPISVAGQYKVMINDVTVRRKQDGKAALLGSFAPGKVMNFTSEEILSGHAEVVLETGRLYRITLLAADGTPLLGRKLTYFTGLLTVELECDGEGSVMFLGEPWWLRFLLDPGTGLMMMPV